MDATVSPTANQAPIGFREFVALIAALIALGALGIDSMLPALPAIGASLGVATENGRQFVVTAFVLGFGAGQLVHGPLSDRFGRRRTLLWSLGLYTIANIACATSGSFVLLLTARVAAGATIAASRVTTVALVRDCYAGRAMAKVMSTAFIVFMIVPVLAPTFGQGVLLLGSWRLIFATIALLTLIIGGWFAWRMPETLHPEDRMSLAFGRIAAGWRLTLGDRWSLGYTLASGALLGGLYGYLNSIQQIMADVFGSPKLLTVIFATTAGTMALANLFNASVVMRLGTRLISHGAVSVLIAVAALHLACSWLGWETLVLFAIFQALTMACFGLAAANFSAMAMQNMGHIAGTASSVQGFLSVTLGSLAGAAIGQAFDGSPRPLIAGFLVSGVVALAIVAVTERGRLFRPA